MSELILAGINISEGYRIDVGAIVGYVSLRNKMDMLTTIGKNLIALSGAIIYKGVVIGDNAIIAHNAIIREESRIGDNFRLWSNSVVDYGCEIGNRVKIHSNCYIAQYTVIQDDVFLAPGVIIGNDLHPGCDFSNECIKRTAVTIKQGAQVGINVTVLPGVTIGERVLIGAGSVVTMDVSAEMVVAGNPAKPVKSIYSLNCRTGLTDKPYHKKRK